MINLCCLYHKHTGTYRKRTVKKPGISMQVFVNIREYHKDRNLFTFFYIYILILSLYSFFTYHNIKSLRYLRYKSLERIDYIKDIRNGITVPITVHEKTGEG